jgi:hypothetical protein
MARKTTPVKYTDRDFESIKTSIVEHAKRHFSNVNKDFNEASFGTKMLLKSHGSWDINFEKIILLQVLLRFL